MNKIHTTVWNQKLGMWVAAAETTKSHRKKSSLSKLTMGAALTAAAAFALPAQAGCDVPTNTATAGSTVTCTGTQTGEYGINAANVTFLNQGTMTADGPLYGVLYVRPSTATGFNGTNQGTINWTNAAYGGTGTGTRAAVNVAYTSPNTNGSLGFLNDTEGVVRADVTTNQVNSKSVAGIALYAPRGNGKIENKGSVVVTSSSNNAYGYISGLDVIGGTSATLINSGSVQVTGNQGTGAEGVVQYIAGLTGDALVDNSGSIVVSGTHAEALGVNFQGVSTSVKSVQFINSGTVELKGGVTPSVDRAVVGISPSASTTSLAIPMVVTNTSTGQILGDSSSGGIIFYGAAATNTTAFHISNSGIIAVGTDAVRTQAGADIFTQDAGSTKGNISLGNGNNTWLYDVSSGT